MVDSIPIGEKNDQPSNGSMDFPVGPSIIEKLHQKGFLSDKARDSAVQKIGSSLQWWHWTGHLLLFLGTALILAGIVFFFAFNWAKLGPFFKFILVEAGILGCMAGVFLIGSHKIVGKILLLCAALLVGVFLAVFGQVYQTGADAFELFTGWALLITGWVAVSSFAALWVMWLTIVNTALILYFAQVLIPNEIAHENTLFILLSVINTAALVFSHMGRSRKWEWLESTWYRRLILSSILTYLSIPSIHFILEPEIQYLLPLIIMILFLTGSFSYYRFYAKDLPSLTLVILTLCILILFALAKLIFPHTQEIGLLIYGFSVIVVFGSASYWIRETSRKMKTVTGGGKNDDEN